MKKALVIGFSALLATAAWAQAAPSGALPLYRELRSAGLDPARVYRVRDVTLDRGSLHVIFTDGTLAFTTAVGGRITGAFFEGDGEVLVSPTSRVERASLALFSGAAIMEERFTTAYLRFNDDTFRQLEPLLRPPDAEASEFLARYDGVATTLADVDALRLLRTFLDQPRTDDRMLHARIGCVHLGTLDVTYDASLAEPVSVAQVARVDAGVFYDLWASFGGGAERFEPLLRLSKYRIRARIQPPHDLQADSEVTLESTAGGQRVLPLELSRYLKVASVTLVDGAGETPLEFLQNEALEGSQLARRGNDLVTVILPQPLAARAPVRLRFSYSGPVMSEAGGGLMYVGARGIWYPNRGLEMADFDLEFRSPANWVLLATGKRVQNDTVGGEQVSRWVSERPIPIAGFNLGQYERAAAKAGNVTVAAYAARGVENAFPGRRQTMVSPLTPPPILPPQQRRQQLPPPDLLPSLPLDPALHAQAVADTAARTIEWIAPRLGPFPFSSLAVTQMPGSFSQGWPGLIFMSSYVFMAEEERTQRQLTPEHHIFFSRVMPMHETIHQWWGDAVIWQSYRDQWLVEAISNYLALMVLERDKPEDVRRILDGYRADLLKKNGDGIALANAGPVTLGGRLSSSKFPSGYEAIAYGRGTWLIHMLREMLRENPPAPAAKGSRARAEARGGNDELFFSALRRLVQEFRSRRLSNADVQKAFESVLPTSLHFEGSNSLDWFFEGWVDGTAIPHLELDEVKIAPRAGRTVATGKILQGDAPRLLVTSVPIYAVGAGAKPVLVGRLFADGDETPFRLNVPAGTRKLLLDPNGTVLSK